ERECWRDHRPGLTDPAEIVSVPSVLQREVRAQTWTQSAWLEEAAEDPHVGHKQASEPDGHAGKTQPHRPDRPKNERTAEARDERHHKETRHRQNAEPEVELETAFAGSRRGNKRRDEDKHRDGGCEDETDVRATHLGCPCLAHSTTPVHHPRSPLRRRP